MSTLFLVKASNKVKIKVLASVLNYGLAVIATSGVSSLRIVRLGIILPGIITDTVNQSSIGSNLVLQYI